MDERAIAAGMEKVRAECGTYDAECIFNVDETGYKILPRQTFLAPTEDRKTTRGVKGTSAKVRITLYVCTNATGVEVPLVAISSTRGHLALYPYSWDTKILSTHFLLHYCMFIPSHG